MDNKIETFEGDTFKRPIVKNNKCVNPETNAEVPLVAYK